MTAHNDANQDAQNERALHSTGSVSSARSDARTQGTKTSDYMPYLPAQSTPFPPEGVDPELLTWSETVSPGGYTHKVLAKGTRIRLEDLSGEGCAHVLFFNALQPAERLNTADTVKIPWQAYLGEGHPLLSGDGRVLATIVADTSKHHDSFCGTTTDVQVQAKFGDDSRVHGYFPSGQALFEQGAIKNGLTLRDLPPSVSFFQGVHVAEDGSLEFTGSAGAGATVDLLTEMPVIMLVANTPHPMDPREDYINGPIRINAWKAEATDANSPHFDDTPEKHRAYLNTIDYLAARGE